MLKEEKRDIFHVELILEECEFIVTHTPKEFDTFNRDELLQRAMAQTFTNIAEECNRLSDCTFGNRLARNSWISQQNRA